MKLRIFFVLICGVIVLFSCNSTTNKDEIKTNSIGSEFEVFVLTDSITSKNEIREMIDTSVFYEEFPMTPQIEYWFRTTYTKNHLNNKDFKKYKSIFLISNGQDCTSKLIRDIFEEEADKAKLKVKKDLWSYNQVIVALPFVKNNEDLRSKLLEYKKQIILEFDNLELRRIRSLYYNLGEQKGYQKDMQEKHQLSVRIPQNFRQLKNEKHTKKLNKLQLEGLIWFRGETKKTTTDIMIFYEKGIRKDIFDPKRIIARRDSVTKYLTEGSADSSYFRVEQKYTTPIFQNIKIGDDKGVEIRGLWETVGDFMGGSFIQYVIKDTKNNRTIYLDGLLYAPGKNKKRFLKRMEVIFSTFKIH